MKGTLVSMMLLVCLSCRESMKTSLIENDTVFVKGNVNAEGELNGRVSYYNRSHGTLISEYQYVDGKLEGKGIKYNRDGSIKSEMSYKNNLLHGFSSFYNHNDDVVYTKYFFNGLSVGPVIEFKKEKVFMYRFLNFEGEEIFHIQYDSIDNKRILDLSRNLFFFNTRNVIKYGDDESLQNSRVCFLYLLSPPKYRFHYCLVSTDKNFTSITVIDSLKSEHPWIEFEIPAIIDSIHRPAIMLDVFDSTNRVWLKAFKGLSLLE